MLYLHYEIIKKKHTMELKKAQKSKVKLKIGISSASGFGKTYSSLLLANGICNDWTKIAVIDSENESASLYSDLGDYNVLVIKPPFSPENYIKAINICENAGIEVIIIDSISHEWEGSGGCLEIHQQLGGQFNHWAKVTPRHNAFINAILQSKSHIICTSRRKQDYDIIKNDKGKSEPIKVGLKEVTREGFEYELTINFEIINENHLCKASKDRTGLYMNKPEFIITKETGKQLIEWANNGITNSAFDKALICIDNNMYEKLANIKAYKWTENELNVLKEKVSLKDKNILSKEEIQMIENFVS